MDITVITRHFDVNNEIKQYAVDTIESAFADFRLKISSASMVLDMQRNLITATFTAAIKECPVTGTSEAFDNVYKAIDEAVSRAATQARKYLDKKQDHKGVGLKDVEIQKTQE